MLPIVEWQALSAVEREAALRRPALSVRPQVIAAAREIIDAVRTDGDRALYALTQRFDGAVLDSLAVPTEIGRASCREECPSLCRSRWSPYH